MVFERGPVRPYPGREGDHGHRAPSGVADTVWDVELHRTDWGRENDYVKWHLRVGERWFHFMRTEHVETGSDRSLTRLSLDSMVEVFPGAAPSLPRHPSLVGRDLAHLYLIAAEGLIVAHSGGPDREVRLHVLDRVWTLGDLELPGRDAARPTLLTHDAWERLRGRPLSPAAWDAVRHSDQPVRFGPEGACDVRSLRGFGPPPPVEGVGRFEFAFMRLGDSFIGEGSFSRLNDLILVPNLDPKTLATDPHTSARSRAGRPLVADEMIDSRALYREMAALLTSRRLAAALRERGIEGMLPAPMDVGAPSELDRALDLVVAAEVGDVDRAADAARAVVQGDRADGIVTVLSCGLAASMVGKAPVGWIPLFFFALGYPFGSYYGGLVLSPASPHASTLLHTWLAELRATLDLPLPARGEEQQLLRFVWWMAHRGQ